ncbi:hypothetical protein ANCDUO_23454 [Ancylostoma duodenale]|uniref:Uncharacterized protein n=1 Tax=Ancylostoma duodenale TaxID=51022 RepID=A0A0C2BRP4_9BILA|nr:hypothetical protein ANCDUO_23454 [Ancylostoma duodenale]
MYRLCQSAARVCSHSDKYSQEMSAAFAMTVLSNMVMIKAVRNIDVDDKLWDEVNNVFLHGIWIQMAQQWSRISHSVTRALILHLAHVDIFTQEDLEKANQGSAAAKKNEVATENETGEENSVDTESTGDNSSFMEGDDITSSVPTWNGNPTIWLQVWRRFMCVLGPHCVSSANALIAVETLSNTIHNLLSANLDPLAHWIASRLVHTPVNLLPHCIASLGTILNCSRKPSSILQAHILHAFIRLIKAGDPQVLPHITSMSPRHLAVLSQHLLQVIPGMITQHPPNTHTLKVLALLSTSNAPAEQLLMKQAIKHELIALTENVIRHHIGRGPLISLPTGSDRFKTNAINKKRVSNPMFSVLQTHRCGPNLLPVLCSCLESLFKVSKNPAALQVILRTIPTLRDDRLRTEVQWAIASLALANSLKSDLPQITKTFLADKQKLLEGAVLTMEGQFPLPGFNVAKWNSVESTPSKPNDTQVFVQRNSAIIGVNKDQQLEITSRTVVGRHCWILEPHKSERKECRNVNAWLQKEAQRGRRAGRESVGILGAMDDPFDSLPRPNNATTNSCSPDWMNILESSRRQPQPLKPVPPSNGKPAISGY